MGERKLAPVARGTQNQRTLRRMPLGCRVQSLSINEETP